MSTTDASKAAPGPSSSRIFTTKRSSRPNGGRAANTSSESESPKLKGSISSIFLSLTFSNSAGKNALKGLGCTSAPDVHTPSSALRPPFADWESRKLSRNPRNRRKTNSGGGKKKKTQVVDSDVWCAPGIPFSTDADSVACVVSRRPQAESSSGTKRNPRHQRNLATDFTFDVDSISRERPYLGRLSPMLEHMSEMDALPSFETSTMNYRRLSGLHNTSGDITDILMLQNSLLFGGMDLCDQYRDWRLDVDNMTYEELLELGNSIGHVNTGLNEEQIAHCLWKMKHASTLASHFACETERKCSICQEEYDIKDELGKLKCGHHFHMCCIKQWLSRKNACPVCKAAAAAAASHRQRKISCLPS